MVGLLVLGVEACHAELAVILDLQRVEAAKRLHFRKKKGKQSY